MNRETASKSAEEVYELIARANLEEPPLSFEIVRNLIQDLSVRVVALTGGDEILSLTHDLVYEQGALTGRLVAFTEKIGIEAAVNTRTAERCGITAWPRKWIKHVSLTSVDFPSAGYGQEWPTKVRVALSLDNGNVLSLPLGKFPSEEAELAFARLLTTFLEESEGPARSS